MALRLLWGLEFRAVDAWASFFSINWVKIFRRDLSCFLRVPYCKNLALFCGWRCLLRSSFGRGRRRRGCCTLDVQESVCQGVLVLVIGSSSSFILVTRSNYRDGQGMSYLFPGLRVWPLASGRNILGRSWGLTSCSFLVANIEQGA